MGVGLSTRTCVAYQELHSLKKKKKTLYPLEGIHCQQLLSCGETLTLSPGKAGILAGFILRMQSNCWVHVSNSSNSIVFRKHHFGGSPLLPLAFIAFLLIFQIDP